MEINRIAADDALPENHPIAQVLSEDERALYGSLVENIQDSIDDIKACQKENGAIDLEAPGLTEATEELRTAYALADLIEEAATARGTSFENRSRQGDSKSDTFDAEQRSFVDE